MAISSCIELSENFRIVVLVEQAHAEKMIYYVYECLLSELNVILILWLRYVVSQILFILHMLSSVTLFQINKVAQLVEEHV